MRMTLSSPGPVANLTMRTHVGEHVRRIARPVAAFSPISQQGVKSAL
jgi:hypothetical protein